MREPARSAAPVDQSCARASREFFASLSPRTLAWSAGAAALAIVLQAAVIAGIVLKEQERGQLSDGIGLREARAAKAPMSLIRFQPQASAAEVTNFLETNKLSIAGGPAGGRALPGARSRATKLPAADLDAASSIRCRATRS